MRRRNIVGLSFQSNTKFNVGIKRQCLIKQKFPKSPHGQADTLNITLNNFTTDISFVSTGRTHVEMEEHPLHIYEGAK